MREGRGKGGRGAVEHPTKAGSRDATVKMSSVRAELVLFPLLILKGACAKLKKRCSCIWIRMLGGVQCKALCTRARAHFISAQLQSLFFHTHRCSALPMTVALQLQPPPCWECPGHCQLCSGAGTGMAVGFLHLSGLSSNVLGCYPAVPQWCPESPRTARRGCVCGWRFWFVDWQERLPL